MVSVNVFFITFSNPALLLGCPPPSFVRLPYSFPLICPSPLPLPSLPSSVSLTPSLPGPPLSVSLTPLLHSFVRLPYPFSPFLRPSPLPLSSFLRPSPLPLPSLPSSVSLTPSLHSLSPLSMHLTTPIAPCSPSPFYPLLTPSPLFPSIHSSSSTSSFPSPLHPSNYVPPKVSLDSIIWSNLTNEYRNQRLFWKTGDINLSPPPPITYW